MTVLRGVGVALAGLGVLIAAFPGWFAALTDSVEPPADTFAAIERRIRGGMVLGVGLVLLARTELRPWSTTLASAVFYFVLGALLARILGLVVEGNDGRQWLWVAGEALVLALAAVWLWRAGTSG